MKKSRIIRKNDAAGAKGGKRLVGRMAGETMLNEEAKI